MKLYTADLSPFAGRCRMLIYFKGIEKDVAFAAPTAALGSAEWKKINPTGKLPALITNGRLLIESEVILEYLEDRFPDPPMRPENLEDRALARLLNRICDLYIFEPMFPLFGQMSPRQRDMAIVEPNLAKVMNGVGHLEAFWPEETGPFVFGPACSLADCGVVPTLFFVDRILPAFGVEDPLARHPQVYSYWLAMNKDPLASRVISELQRGLDERRAKAAG
ncbi:MAG: glutathione S-transferase family protein [Alphaproteobacteria bacterium]|nr:MAG: glutathione S-transferase family protein [Alphaproteobacteria bacterium]